jgi:hypothetical protein
MRLAAALNFVSFLALVRLASTGHVYELTSQPGAVPRCDPTGSTNADSDGSAVDCLEHQPDTGDGGGTLKLVLVILVAILTAFAIVCACFLRHRYAFANWLRCVAVACAREQSNQGLRCG